MYGAQRNEVTPRGPANKIAVTGIKDRDSNQVLAKVAKRTDKATLQGFVADNLDPDATVYTDDARAYNERPFDHATVKHPVA